MAFAVPALYSKWPWLLGCLVMAAGCDVLLGLDEFASESGGGGGQAGVGGSSSQGSSSSGQGGDGCVDQQCCEESCTATCFGCEEMAGSWQCVPEPIAPGPGCNDGGETCDGSGNCLSGKAEWVVAFGSSTSEVKADVVTVGPSGAVFVGGDYLNTGWTAGNTIFPAPSAQDVYLLRLSPGSDIEWAAHIGGVSLESIQGISANEAGVYIAGSYGDSITFGEAEVTNNFGADLYAARYSNAGVYLDHYVRGSSEHDAARGLTLAADGTVLVVGHFSHLIQFEMGTNVASNGYSDAFAVRLTPDLNYIDHANWGSTLNDQVKDVASHDGQLSLCGALTGEVSFGGGGIGSGNSDHDAFLARFDASFAHQWSAAYGEELIQRCEDVAVAADGSAAISGSLLGTMTFGRDVLEKGPAGAMYLAKMVAQGVPLWARALQCSNSMGHGGLAVDESGNLVLGGWFTGTLDTGTGTMTSSGQGTIDGFVMKLTPDGTMLWLKHLDGDDEIRVFDVAVAPNDEIYAVGRLNGTLQVDGNSANSTGGQPYGFAVKLAP